MIGTPSAVPDWHSRGQDDEKQAFTEQAGAGERVSSGGPSGRMLNAPKALELRAQGKTHGRSTGN